MSQLKDFYVYIPKKLIFISFILALMVDFIPISGSVQWLPEITLLVLIYWLANCPQYINLGMAFVLGLLVDIGSAALLGGHALAYILAAYLIIINHRQFGVQNYGFQAVLVLSALMISEVVLLLIHLIDTHRFVGWSALLAPFVGALLWLPLSTLLKYIQHRLHY